MRPAAARKPVPRTKRDVVVEFRRETILDAALRAFARSGYEGTSVDTIAAEASIAKGTVYLYFESKAEIYLSAIMHEANKLYAETERRFAGLPTCRQKIEQYIRIRLEYAESHRDFCRIYFSEFGSTIHPAPIQKELRKMYRRQADLLASIVSGGIAAGEIRPISVHAAAFAILDVTRGLVEKRLLGWSDADVETDIQALADLLWSGLNNAETA
jgi:AcrR family transcriptional regulator